MFNPLDHIEDQPKKSESTDSAVSTSSLDFSSEEVCPKCNSRFETAQAAAGIPVRYCAACRVAIPFKD